MRRLGKCPNGLCAIHARIKTCYACAKQRFAGSYSLAVAVTYACVEAVESRRLHRPTPAGNSKLHPPSSRLTYSVVTIALVLLGRGQARHHRVQVR